GVAAGAIEDVPECVGLRWLAGVEVRDSRNLMDSSAVQTALLAAIDEDSDTWWVLDVADRWRLGDWAQVLERAAVTILVLPTTVECAKQLVQLGAALRQLAVRPHFALVQTSR